MTTESPFLPHVEQDILKDFSCCDLDLPDLHALLRHYEEKHASGFDEDDMGMDLDGYDDDSSPTFQGTREKPDIAALKRRARFNVMRNLAQSNSVFDFDLDVKPNVKRPAPFPSPALSGREPTFDLYSSQWSSQSSPIESPDQSFPSTPVTTLHDLDVNATKDWSAADWAQLPISQVSQPQAIRKSRQLTETPGVVSPENTIVVDKPYKCRNLGCDKAYKNMNGLKYHRMHGVCNKNNLTVDLGNASPAPQTPPASGVSTPTTSVPNSPALPLHPGFNNPVIEEKKYSCEKCNKRYKNLNGLKYHKKASHKSVEDVAAAPFSLASGMSFSKLH